MGLDSLMAVELVTGLGSALRMKIPATTVFNYPDVTALAAHLVSQAAGASASVVRIPKPAASPAADISEEDAIAALLGNGPAALPGGNAEPGTGEWTSAGVGASTGD
jgi:pimaricinolide synthase PimS1